MVETLKSFWIVLPGSPGSIGYGVTAFSLSDAFNIIRSFDYEIPDDISTLRITEGVRVDELDKQHVIPNMGPVVVRGLWFPFCKIGV